MSLNEKEIKKSDREVDLGGFKMRDDLNPKIWDGDVMKSDVRKTLLKIADDYFDGLDLEGVDIEDITMTGSLANYNWSKYSDVDLHIVIDYKDLPMKEDMVLDYLKSKSDVWNDKHDIKIYGFDVEIYVQDKNEEHVSSGVYSVFKNEWNIKPEKKKISINDNGVKQKANRIMDWIDDLYDIFNETNRRGNALDNNEEDELFELITKKADKIKDKIKKMRQCGLDEGGEYSVENMVFKVLRRNGMLERLGDIKTVSYDKSMTLESLRESDDLSWMDEIEGAYTPRIGDVVRMKHGFTNNKSGGVNHDIRNGRYEIDNPVYGGGGYDEPTSDTFTIRSIDGLVDGSQSRVDVADGSNIYISKRSGRQGWILWLSNGGGVWSDAVVPVNNINESDDLSWMDEIPTLMEYTPDNPPMIGDIVLCKDGFTDNSSDDNYGGGGYVEGDQFEINVVSDYQSQNILHNKRGNQAVVWSTDGERHGIFSDAVWLVHRPNNINESEDDFDWVRDTNPESDFLDDDWTRWMVDGLIGDDEVFAYYVTAMERIESRAGSDKVLEIKQKILINKEEPSSVICEVMGEVLKDGLELPKRLADDDLRVKTVICKDARKKKPFLKRVKSRLFGESEEDDFGWMNETKPFSLEFDGNEIWIDISKLDVKEKQSVMDYVVDEMKPKLKGTYSRVVEMFYRTTSRFNGIIAHCGHEIHDYEPTEGSLCTMTHTYGEDDKVDESSTYINGLDVLDIINNR